MSHRALLSVVWKCQKILPCIRVRKEQNAFLRSLVTLVELASAGTRARAFPVTARLLSRSGVVASRREEPAPPRRREPERNPRAARGGVSSALERGWKEEHFTDSTPSSLIMAIIASTPENDAAVLATLPYLLLTIAFTFLAVVRKSVSLSLMEGLTCYILPETDEERWRARIAKATHEKKSSESKRRAKGARAPPAGNIDELGENSIAAIAMTKNQLILKPFWSHVDRLVFFACLVIVHCVAREVHAFVVASDGGAGSDAEGTTTTTTTNVLLAPLAAFSAVSAMRALVRAAIDPASTPAVERHVAVAAGFIGFAFSLVFLLSSPAFAARVRSGRDRAAHRGRDARGDARVRHGDRHARGDAGVRRAQRARRVHKRGALRAGGSRRAVLQGAISLLRRSHMTTPSAW